MEDRPIETKIITKNSSSALPAWAMQMIVNLLHEMKASPARRYQVQVEVPSGENGPSWTITPLVEG